MDLYIVYGIVALLIVGAAWLWHHQRSLRVRAELMQEAVRNRDFMFRLPTDGLLPGERAMQEALNRLGDIVRQQVSRNEVEAWERLTRVLTHEIMNATAPIASITQSMLRRDDVKGQPIEEGIMAIHDTSARLTTFVDSYRKLSQLQQPAPEDVDLGALVRSTALLYPTLRWTVSVPEGATLHTDPGMLTQTLVNMAKNALEADAHCMEVALDDRLLMISNDGKPIPAEVRQSIFVPFFTTKSTGSGIGLPLCRRMMMQQGATMLLAEHSRAGFHTTFVVQFP